MMRSLLYKPTKIFWYVAVKLKDNFAVLKFVELSQRHQNILKIWTSGLIEKGEPNGILKKHR